MIKVNIQHLLIEKKGKEGKNNYLKIMWTIFFRRLWDTYDRIS